MDSLEHLADSVVRVNPARIVDDRVTALISEPQPVEGYVWPSLRDWKGEPGSRIVLIDAAGAVGKTAAAHAFAKCSGWPLVDSAKAQVGSYSLSGLIQDALGFESNFLQDLAIGSAGVVIDALDEAHLKAGTTNFLAFLENMANMVRNTTTDQVALVLFSRPDTAELVHEYFRSIGTPISRTSIEFLNYSQAIKLIDSYMGSRAFDLSNRPYDVYKKHAQAFATMRDSVLADVAAALLSRQVDNIDNVWPEVFDFLGYAPVLFVLSEYFAVPNPAKVHGLNLEGDGKRRILLRIIDNLLDREQDKFQQQALNKLQSHIPAEAEEWRSATDCYSPNEQILRLIAKTFSLELTDYPPHLPSEIRKDYEEHAQQFVADHPFLIGSEIVNVVFEDYLKAKAAVGEIYSAALYPSPADRIDRAGPFFCDFVHEFSPRPDSDGPPELDEKFISLVIESHTQSLQTSPRLAFFYTQSDTDASLMLGGGPDAPGFIFDIVNLSGLITLPDRVARGIVRTDGGVAFLSRDRTILGPLLLIICDELIIESDRISIEAPLRHPDPENETPPTLLNARSISTTKAASIECNANNSLVVLGDHPWPFAPYANKADEHKQRLILYSDMVDLRSIIRVFKRSIGGPRTAYVEKLRQRIVKDNPSRLNFLRQLVNLGVISEAGSHFQLDIAVLDNYGVNISDIMNANPTTSVLKFIDLLTRRCEDPRN